MDRSKAPIQELMKSHLREISTARGKKIIAEQKVPGGCKPGAWPMVSMNLGCPPRQVASMRKFLKSKGVDCDFTTKGEAILTDIHHRRRVCQARQMFDQNAGYSDAMPSDVHSEDDREQQAPIRAYESMISDLDRRIAAYERG